MDLPDFSNEHKLHKQGYKLIAGVDEVGRGCFAGAVVAAAVAFAPNFNEFSKGIIINDSKKLSAKQREVADKWIRKNAISFGIGQASVAQINRLGIKKTTEIAFRKAIDETSKKLEDGILKRDNEVRKLKSEDRSFKSRPSNVNFHNPTSNFKRQSSRIDYLLIDAFYIPYVKGLRRKNQKAIIKGDTKSISIAAASIVAKVYRDKLMTALSKKAMYRKYKWYKNKGYGTKEHQEMIRKHGVSNLHRRQFVQTFLKKFEDGNMKLEKKNE